MIKVNNVKKVNKTHYKEGDFFIQGSDLFVLIDGKIHPVQTKKISLSGYIKKTDLDKHLKETYPELFKKR